MPSLKVETELFFMRQSGFDHTDIVKCDGEFFLKACSSLSTLLCNISITNQQEGLILGGDLIP